MRTTWRKLGKTPEILRAIKAGRNPNYIAKKYGVTRAAIYNLGRYYGLTVTTKKAKRCTHTTKRGRE